MRINPKLEPHQHHYKNVDTPTGDARRMFGVDQAMRNRSFAAPKAPNAAGPLITNRLLDKAVYRTGDGDPFHSVQRPGSDHSHLKSKGHPC
jgi:hypothetical protein